MQEPGDEGIATNEAQEGAPPANTPASIWRKIILLMGLTCLLAAAIAAYGYYWLDKDLHQPRTFSGQTFSINKGDTLKGFAAQLKHERVISQTLPLALYARYSGQAGKLHTGHYRFSDGLNLLEVLDAITSGSLRLSYSFTFVQGSTFKQLRESLAANGKVGQTLGEKSDAEVLALFDIEQDYSHPEGLFFPETYAFDPGANDVDILRRAYTTMQKTLHELWEQRSSDLQITTPYEALILASIIEKETALASERKQISGVFMNRLKKGMKLQTDPTVIYGVGDSYDGNITRAHLTTDTPYNTYTRHGLPPSPIAMPGRAAIEAAVMPEKTDALFFVATGDGSGGHTFTRTLSEHNKAVKQYLKNRRNAG